MTTRPLTRFRQTLTDAVVQQVIGLYNLAHSLVFTRTQSVTHWSGMACPNANDRLLTGI